MYVCVSVHVCACVYVDVQGTDTDAERTPQREGRVTPVFGRLKQGGKGQLER